MNVVVDVPKAWVQTGGEERTAETAARRTPDKMSMKMRGHAMQRCMEPDAMRSLHSASSNAYKTKKKGRFAKDMDLRSKGGRD